MDRALLVVTFVLSFSLAIEAIRLMVRVERNDRLLTVPAEHELLLQEARREVEAIAASVMQPELVLPKPKPTPKPTLSRSYKGDYYNDFSRIYMRNYKYAKRAWRLVVTEPIKAGFVTEGTPALEEIQQMKAEVLEVKTLMEKMRTGTSSSGPH